MPIRLTARYQLDGAAAAPAPSVGWFPSYHTPFILALIQAKPSQPTKPTKPLVRDWNAAIDPPPPPPLVILILEGFSIHFFRLIDRAHKTGTKYRYRYRYVPAIKV